MRFLSTIVFLALAVYFVSVAYSNNEMLKKGITDEMGVMDLYVGFLIMGVVFCQSDFKVFLFGIFPVYIAASVLINRKREMNQKNLIQ